MLLNKSTLITLVCLLLSVPAYGKDNTIAVIYPRVSEPYNQVFLAIIDGIKSEFDDETITLKTLEKSDDNQSFSAWLNNENPEMIIALGKRGYQYAKNLTKPEAIVIGALPIKPNGISGVSLLGDPKVLFESLQLLAPQIKQVNVVYSKNSEWLINLAEDHSQNMGLVFKKIKVDSIKDAASEYEKLLNNLDAKTDAIWLPLDPLTANEQVILPNLLEKSWQQNFVLFSSKPAHTKRGALFSMFPNHFELGQQLAAMVEGIHTTRTKAGVVPLKSKHLAVNLRTANHLGFKYNNQQKKSFYLTFPN